MSGSAAFSQRLAAFKENFKQILGRKHTGYDELSGLERPLVSHEDGQDDSFGQGAAPAGHYQGPVPGYEGANRYQAAHGGQAADSFTTATAVPSQADEIRQMAGLSREAAELLWELTVMDDSAGAAEEMLQKAKLLQAQLRGLIGDFTDDDESVLANALEAFDVLNRSLEEYESVKSPTANAGAKKQTEPALTLAAPPGHSSAPSATPAPAAAQAEEEEAPLIEL